MKGKLFCVILWVSVIPSTSFGQTLSESIDEHDKVVEAAAEKVSNEWQKLLTEAIKTNDQTLVGEYRTWSDWFQNERGMFFPVKHREMVTVYRKYGAEIKAAGDKLRNIYLKEADRLRAAGDTVEADALIVELTERRLPGKLVSIQPYRSQKFVVHGNFFLSAMPAKELGVRMNATFELQAGLGEMGLISMRPCNFPRLYLCHQGFRVNLMNEQPDPSWRMHATWQRMPGLADDKKGVSFRSLSHPGRYIRLRGNGELWLDEFNESPQFRRDCTFVMRSPLFELWPSIEKPNEKGGKSGAEKGDDQQADADDKDD